MAAGAAAATIVGFNPGDPTTSFTATMPVVIKDFTLIAIAIGAIAANALNIYSGAMSFLAAGITIPFALRRAIIALGFGIVGFFIAWSALADAGRTYEGFLLVIAYWIAPWLGVVLIDRYLRRGTEIVSIVTDAARYRNAAGLIAFLVGLIASITLFSNQAFYVGVIPRLAPAVGDLTAIVGLLLSAITYVLLFRALKPTLGAELETTVEPASAPIPGAHSADTAA